MSSILIVIYNVDAIAWFESVVDLGYIPTSLEVKT